jgi:hypothetical protein
VKYLKISSNRIQMTIKTYSEGMSVFYNTIVRSASELYDFAVLFFLVTVVMGMCGYIVFGYGTSHPLFDSITMSIGTSLGIAFGHISHDDVISENKFGINLMIANGFYWVLLIIMFLMFNILLAIILDAFEKTKDDRRQIDAPFVEIIAKASVRKLRKLFCCKKDKNTQAKKAKKVQPKQEEQEGSEFNIRKSMTSIIQKGDKTIQSAADAINHAIRSLEMRDEKRDEKRAARYFLEKKGITRQLLHSKGIQKLYVEERNKMHNGGRSNEKIENILSNIKFKYEDMKKQLENTKVNEKTTADLTTDFFKAYGRNAEQSEAFELQLQEVQSHVTKSLKKTDEKILRTEQKLDLILKHLKLEK